MDLGTDAKQVGCRLGGAEVYHVECDGVPCLTLRGGCVPGELRALVDSWCAINPLQARRVQQMGVVLNLERLQVYGAPDGVDLLGARVPVAGYVARGECVASLRALAISHLPCGLLRGVFTSSDLATEWVRERARALRLYRSWRAT